MARRKQTAADLGAWLCFEDQAGQGLRPPKGRTWGRRGHTPVVWVTAAGTKRVSMAALICTKSGRLPRLIYRIVLTRLRREERTQRYLQRRSTEGKTKREVIRCLKRYVAREIYDAIRFPNVLRWSGMGGHELRLVAGEMSVVRPLVWLVEVVAGAVGARSAGSPGEESSGRDRAVAGGGRAGAGRAR